MKHGVSYRHRQQSTSEVVTHVLHELLARWPNLLRQRGREHHHLLMMRRSAENVLHITTHIDLLQHLVALIQNKVLHAASLQALVTNESVHATRRAHDDMRALGLILEDRLVVGDRGTAIENGGAHARHVLGEPSVFIPDLVGQFTRVTQDDHAHVSVHRLDLLQGSQDEHSRLSHTRLCLTDDIHAQD